MDWNGNLRQPPPPPPPFVSRPEASSLSFLYNYNNDQFPVAGTEMMKHSMVVGQTVTPPPHGMVPMMMESTNNMMGRKKRLTNEQLESLECSFREEIKLDPDRKMKLAHELRLQPRQVAVWFQNRRARWKAKQLELLYDSLKHQLDAVCRENQKLQEEVMALRAILKDQTMRNLVSTGCTDISGGEPVESTSAAIRSSSNKSRETNSDHYQDILECNYFFNTDDYIPVVMPPPQPPYWGGPPSTYR